jgi:hypothetical protein
MEEELDNVNVDSKKATEKNRKKSVATVAKLKKIATKKKDKETRLNRRADKIAARKGLEGSGVFNEDGIPDNESLMKARKGGRKIIDDRKAARKQYLRNFASQLARGEQAAPSKGFGEGEEGKPTTASSLVGVQKEIDAKKQQADQDQKSIYANVNTFTAPNQDLGNYSDFGKNLMQQMEMPDLSPVKYMQQEYRKKRGY